MNAVESKYVEKKGYLSRYTHERAVTIREAEGLQWRRIYESEDDWLRSVQKEFPRFIPFLEKKRGVVFRGRILEIGAGGAWLSAELSKLPRVVEVIATDFSPKMLKEEAPRIFKLLKANSSKITRMPGDFHKLDFQDRHFDFVVSSAVLYHATNIVQVLREVKRVLKPGGQLVSIREPVWPRMKMKSRAKKSGKTSGVSGRFTLDDYKEVFRQAGFPMEVKRVNLSRGLKYLFDEMVNGLTHARYAFVATRKT